MGKGKSIRIIIPDGNPKNAIEVTMPSWDGIAIRIKREYLGTAKDTVALEQCGVYFLYGKIKTSAGTFSQKVYVGQGVLRQNGKGVFWRIREHDVSSEEYWTDAIAFVDRKNEWGKTETSYLENCFTNLVLETKEKRGNYEVINVINPNPGNVTKAKQWELDDYIDGAKLILQILGYDFLSEEKYSISEEESSIRAVKTLDCEMKGARASGQKTCCKSVSNAKAKFPFKVGRVMSCAFRKALETGLLKDQLEFLESKCASSLFKTRGNRVIVSGERPSNDAGGRNRFAKDPVLFQGKTYWITTQVWDSGLANILLFLEQNGMSHKRVEEICRSFMEKSSPRRDRKNHRRPPCKSFFEYLRKSMCKNTASNYSSAFRVLEAELVKRGIISVALSNDITSLKLSEIKKFVSSDRSFLAYNKRHHHSLSAAFGKFLEYLDTCDTVSIMKH